MDVMLDLETLGVRCGSVILSIGACTFDRATGASDNHFHAFLKPKGQVALGMTMDPSTIMWWLGQSEAARRAMLAGQDEAKEPYEALMLLNEWFNGWTGEVPALKVWANGADFDLALLAELYRRFGLQPPWPYNGARDMRTVMDLAGVKPADLIPAPTGAHDALVDAVYQSRVTAKALNIIKG